MPAAAVATSQRTNSAPMSSRSPSSRCIPGWPSRASSAASGAQPGSGSSAVVMKTNWRSGPYVGGIADRLPDHRHDPAPRLAGALGHQLLDPIAEAGQARRSQDGQLVPAGDRRFSHRGTQPQAGIVGGRATARIGHLNRPREQAFQVDAMQRRGQQPEHRKGAVAAADVRRPLDDGPESLRARQFSQHVPGSVIATKSSAGACALMAAWKAFGSVVEPDLLLTQKIVRPDSAHSRKPRTTSGCVESRIRSSSPDPICAGAPKASPKTRLNSSGARLEPPMPSTAARVYPSARTSRATRCSSPTRAPMLTGRSSQPSHAAISSGPLAR